MTDPSLVVTRLEYEKNTEHTIKGCCILCSDAYKRRIDIHSEFTYLYYKIKERFDSYIHSIHQMAYCARYYLFILLEYRLKIELHKRKFPYASCKIKYNNELTMFPYGVSNIIAEYAVCCKTTYSLKRPFCKVESGINKLTEILLVNFRTIIQQHETGGVTDVDRRLYMAMVHINIGKTDDRKTYKLTLDIIRNLLILYDNHQTIEDVHSCTDFVNKYVKIINGSFDKDVIMVQ